MNLSEKVAKGQMQTYTGTKTVKAIPTTKREYLEYRGWDVPKGEDPEEVIYLVEYAVDPKSTPNHDAHEGYITMSPKHVFDEAYRSNGKLTFGMAVEAMKDGKKTVREGWNGKEMFLVVSPGARGLPSSDFFNKDLAEHAKKLGGFMDVRPAFMLKTAQEDVAYWSPSGSDALAEDWIILD